MGKGTALSVPTKILEDQGLLKQGFYPISTDQMSRLYGLSNYIFAERPDCETDAEHQQIVPYMVFRHCDPEHGSHYLVYQRAKGGEDRLLGKHSLGVGGHVEVSDHKANEPIVPFQTLLNGMWREIEEEILLGSPVKQVTFLGLVRDKETPVGKVHLGVVYLFDLTGRAVKSRTPELHNLHFVRYSSLRDETYQFERWSEMLFDKLLTETPFVY
jgi:predicted NUDIX family phosphoesterase